MLSSLVYWAQLVLGLFVLFPSLLQFTVGNSAHITGLGSKPCLNCIRIIFKTRQKYILLYFIAFFFFACFNLKNGTKKSIDARFCIMQHETSMTPAEQQQDAPNLSQRPEQEVPATHVAISIKLTELKRFTGAIMQARAWLSALKHYFIAIHIPYTGNDTT